MADQRVGLHEEPLYGLWSRHGNPPLMDRPHRHNELELNLLERGCIHYSFPGQRIVIPEGRLFLFWAGVPHQLIWMADDTYIHWMTFPLAWLLRWQLSDALIQPLLRGQPAIDPDSPSLIADLAGFYRWHADLESGLEERKRVLMLELEARMRRMDLASNLSGQLNPLSSPHQKPGLLEHSGKAEKMAGYLAKNFALDWSPENAAKVVGIHPNYAMNLFQRTFGVSMVVYVTQLRVAMAQKLLITTTMEILDIAYECGFGSASRFYEAFKAIAGTTPYRYRKSMQWA